MRKEISVATRATSELIDITKSVQAAVTSSKVESGLCLLYVPHTTCAICINENADPTVKTDIIRTLQALIPRDGDYDHAEGNSDAHVKSSIMGSSRFLFIESCRLVLGTWQGIYLCEFDGPRSRKVSLKIIDA